MSSYDANELIVEPNSVLIYVRKWFMKNSSFNSVYFNRPFPSSKNYHFQNEARCETFLVKMSYICMKIKNSCYINSYDFSLALNQRLKATRKWSIGLAVLSAVCPLRDHVTVSMSSVYEDGKHREMGLLVKCYDCLRIY